MVTTIATLQAVIGADISGLIGGLKEADTGLSGFASSMSDKLQNIGGSMTQLGGALTLLTTPITAFLGTSLKQAADSEQALGQLGAVLKSTGGAAGVTAKMATDLADSLQKVTRFSDDTTLGAEDLLLTFTNISKDIFPDVTRATQDMATAMHMDLNSAALQLGKALQDPVTGTASLRREGVKLTASQEDLVKSLVKSGDLMGAQKIILKELQKEFGGSAVAAGQTFAGQLDILNNKFGDMQKKIGFALMPTLMKLAGGIGDVIDKVSGWIDRNPELTDTIVKLAGALAVAGPALIVFGTLLTNIGTIVGAFAEGGLLAGLAPFLPVILAIAGGFLAWQNNLFGIRDTLQPIIDKLTAGIQGIVKAFNGDLTGALQAFKTSGLSDDVAAKLSGILGGAGDAIRAFIAGLPINLQTITFTIGYWFGKIWGIVQPALKPIADWFSGTGPNSLGGALQAVAGWIDQNVVAPLKGIWVLVQPEVQKIVDWFNNDFLGVIQQVAGWVNTNIITPFNNLMAQLQPVFQQLADFVRGIFQPVIDFINKAVDSWNMLRSIGGGGVIKKNPDVNPDYPSILHPPVTGGQGGASFPPALPPVRETQGGSGIPFPAATPHFGAGAGRGYGALTAKSVTVSGGIHVHLPNMRDASQDELDKVTEAVLMALARA